MRRTESEVTPKAPGRKSIGSTSSGLNPVRDEGERGKKDDLLVRMLLTSL